MKTTMIILGFVLMVLSCKKSEFTDYTGSASISYGLAETTHDNLYSAGQRTAPVGKITASDQTTWTVPSETAYLDAAIPFATDLYNPDGIQHATSAAALAAFNNENIVVIDSLGTIVTAYVFADNYFELYVNGTAIGKDAIPFTGFNSHILKFKVSYPFTIAMKLVDWEENLGLGSENNQGRQYHPGDGGMVAVFHDEQGNTIAKTDHNWKAQTFYTAPVDDLTCVSETGTLRLSDNCNTDGKGVLSGKKQYALHWEIPSDWTMANFDDSAWPTATTYTNDEIGVNNKAAYTNYTNIFDDPTGDATFIWSTNVILDNLVLVRYVVE